jgi:hypothetical protein
MTLKYARERALVQTVYDEEEFAVVKHQDSPDFVLQHRGAVTSFGVEVTEVFETEADARVRAYPDYIGRLLAGDRHIHRDDLEVLKVTRVSIHAPDGSLKSGNVPAIFRQAPTNQEHYEAVADRLIRKDTRIDTYSKGLSHVNLILADHFGPAPELGSDGQYSTADILIPSLRAALLRTRFQEVFLISTNGSDRRVYRPLQQLMLLEAFFTFCKACQSFTGGDFEVADLIPLFVHTYRDSGMALEVRPYKDGLQCVTYRGAGVTLGQSGIQILDFHDHSLPASIPVPALRFSSPVLGAFAAYHAEFAAGNAFVTALAVDAGDAELP